MAWCPKCKSEYRDGFTICPTCGVYLLDALPQTDQFVLLASFSDTQQKALAMQLLREAQIPVFSKDRGAGGYVRVITGSSVFGEDLYVPVHCRQQALLRIAQLLEPPDTAGCGEAELDAAYDRYMQTHELPPETDTPSSQQGYRLLLCFLGAFALLCVFALLKVLL